MPESSHERRRRRWCAEDDFVDPGQTRHDSAGEEGVEDAAEEMAASVRSGETQTGGAFTAMVAFPRWPMREREGARSGKMGRGERDAGCVVVALSVLGGHGSEGAGEEDTAMAAAVLPLSRTGKRERRAVRGGPVSGFSYFCLFPFSI